MNYLSIRMSSVKLSTETDQAFKTRRSAIEQIEKAIKRKRAAPSLLPLLLAACGGGGSSSPAPSTPQAPPPPPTPDFTESPTNTFTARDDNNRTLSEGNSTADLIVVGKGGNDTITSGSGADIILGGAGADAINSGDGDDIIVLIGTTSSDQYTDSSITNPAVVGTDLSALLSLSDINGHSVSDAASGETLDGGAGNNTLVIYGNTDVSSTTISNLATVWINSTLTLTAAQLSAMTAIVGDGSSALNIIGSSNQGTFDTVNLSNIDVSGIDSIESNGNVELIISNVSQLDGITQIVTTFSFIITIASNTTVYASDLARVLATGAHIKVEEGATLLLDTVVAVNALGDFEIEGDGDIVISDAVAGTVDSLSSLTVDDDITFVDTIGTPVSATALGATIIHDIAEGSGIVPTLSVPDITVSESEAAATLTFELNANYYETISVDYINSHGESGTVTFKAGTHVTTVTLNWIDDDVNGGISYISYQFSNPQNVILADTSATIKILDDEGGPYISFDSVYANEADESATFTATLSSASSEVVSFYYPSFDGKTLHKVTFSPGETTQTFTLTWDDDAIAERDFTYHNVYLSHPYNAKFDLEPGLAVIIEDDDGLETDGSPDYLASTDTQALMEIGSTFNGYFSSTDDVDWIAMDLVAGQTYHFEIAYDAPIVRHLETDLINPRGIYGVGSGGSRNDGTIIYNLTATESGTYYIQLGQYYRTQKIGSYTINSSIIDIREPDGGADYDNSTNTRAVHELGEASQGSHSLGGDDDYFKVTLEAGTTYKFNLTYPPSDIGNNQGLFLNILNEEGMSLHMPVEQVEGHTYLTVTIEQAGTYFIAVQNYTLAYLGDYSLTSQIIGTTEPNGTADIAGNNSSTTLVSIGGTVNGNLSNSNDKDWIGFTAEAGVIYKITINGTDIGDSSFFYNIFDAEGNWILEGDYPRDDNKASSLGNGDVEIYWKAVEAGNYFVEVGSQEFHIGNYEASVVVDDNKEPDGGEDYSNTTDTRGVIEVGGSIQGSIGYEMDGADRFKVELEEGKIYQFTIAGYDEGGGTIDSSNSSMWVLITGVGSRESHNGILTMVALYSGTYYAYVDDWRGTGTYTISVNEIFADEPDGSPEAFDDMNTTAIAEVGTAYEGNIAYESDHDFVAISLDAGQIYHLEITGSEALQEFELELIAEPEGQGLNGVGGYGTLDESINIYFEAETSGIYYFRIGGGDSGDYPSGNYTVTVSEDTGNDSDGAADVGDTFETALTVSDGEALTSRLAYIGDQDLYAVEMNAGEVWSLTINTPEGGTLEHYFMGYVYNEAGERFSPEIERDTGDGSRIIHFVVPADGIYYISVEETISLVPGDYELSIEKLDSTEPDGSLDYGNSLDTAFEITANSTTQGTLSHIGDVDYFTVTFEAGQTYQFNIVTGSDAPEGSTYMYISNSNDWGGSTNIYAHESEDAWTFTANESGSYSFTVGDNSNYIGDYTITSTTIDISEPDGDSDFLDSMNTRGTLAVGETLQGEISFTKKLGGYGGDKDWFAVELIADETYIIEVTGATLVSAGILSFRNSDGVGVYWWTNENGTSFTNGTDANGGVDNQVTFTVEESGTYYIEVTDMNTWSTGTYSISMNKAGEEKAVSGADSAASLIMNSTSGGQLDTDVLVFDSAWGQGTIEGFNDGIDLLDFSGSTLAFADLTITQSGADTLVEDASSNSITLKGITSTDITVDDFLFQQLKLSDKYPTHLNR